MSHSKNEYLPLTQMQRGVFVDSSAADGDDPYIIQVMVDFADRLDAGRFMRTVDAVTGAHPAVRACFRTRASGEPVQIVLPTVHVPGALDDLRGTAPEEVADRLEEIRREDSATVFDLSRAPLMRYRIVDLPGDRSHLLFSFHHLVVDGWSVFVFFRDLVAAYAGADPLPEFTFREYLEWESQVDPAAADESFARVLEGLAGPSLIAEPIVDGEPGEQVIATELSTAETASLTSWCRRREVSLAAVVEVCWAQSVALQADRTDVVIGVMEANRSFGAAGIASAVGLFANVVPLRVDLGVPATVAQVCEAVARQRLETLPHRHLSLGRIQAAYGGAPLFDTIVTFQNYRSADVVDGDAGGDGYAVRIIAARSHTPTTQPAMLAVIPGGALTVELSYRTEAMSPGRARVLLDVFAHLLASVPECADLDVRKWPLPSADVPAATIESAAAGAQEPLLPAQLLAAAERHGPRLALTTATGTMTYRELFGEALAVAGWLREDHGVGVGDVVAVTVAQGRLAVVARLGVLLAGAAICPLDPEAVGRDDLVVPGKADACVVLAEGTAAPARHGAETVLLDDGAVVAEIMRRGDLPGTAIDIGATDEAVRVPDRVPSRRNPVTHGALAAAVAGCADQLGLTSRDTLLATAAGSALVLAALIRGAHVVLGGGGTPGATPFLSGRCREATVVEGSASALGHAVRSDPSVFQGRRVVVSRPPLTRSTADTIRAAGARMWLAYAPGGVLACLTPVDDDSFAAAIGHPLDGARLQVLDPQGRLVPRGAVGEIAVADDGVWRTGDVGRRGDRGRVEHLGAADQRLEIRGQRIEPWVIEEVLTAAPGVVEAAVVRVDGPHSQMLVAHVAPASVDVAVVERAVRGRLPRYATPSRIVAWPHLPRGTTGDVDLDELAGHVEEGETSPATVARLMALFAEITGVADVSPHADFFALGGDSIGITRLRALAASRHGWDLGLRLVLDLRTPAAIAREVAVARPPSAVGAPVPAPDEADSLPRRAADSGREGVVVGTQASLWLLNQLDPESSGYNLSLALDLEGDFDEAALVAAVDDVAERHEILRTRYEQRAGVLVQRIEPLLSGRPLLSVVNTPAYALDRVLAKSAGQGFRLDEELPLRAELHRVAPDRAVLLLLFHHIAIDGTSFLALARDLTLAYTARSRGEAPRFGSPPVQYLDYATWSARRLGAVDGSGTRAAQQAAFWRGHLKGLADATGIPLEPDGNEEGDGDGHPATRLLFHWGPEVGDAVSRIARRAGSTRFAVYQTAMAAAMHSLGAPTEIALGAPVSVRPHVNLEDAIGNYSNFVVSRVQLELDDSLGGNSARRGRSLADELDHQDLPFNEVVRAVNATRRPGRNPLYQTVLALQNFEKPTARLDGVVVTERLMPVVDARVDLVVAVVEGGPGEGVILSAEFTQRAYSAQTIASFVERFHQLLICGAADWDVPLSRHLRELGVGAAAAPVLPATAAGAIPTSDPFAVAARDADTQTSPTDALLAEVVAAYGTAIRFTEVDPDVGYFDAGGDSIGTVSVAAALASHHVDIATLMAGPSARELAARIASGEFSNGPGTMGAAFAGVAAAGYDVDMLEPFATLLPIRPTGSQRPLFVFHGGVGLSIPYTGLSGVIDSEIPIYGLQSTEPIFGAPAAESLTEQVMHYLERIRAVQPQGPYRLLGWSYGGWAAHEAARIIEEDGDEVELLVIIDSEVPVGTERSWGPELPREAIVRAFTSVLGIAEEDGSDITSAERLHAAFQRTEGAFAQLTPDQVGRFVDVMQRHARLARRHRPGTVSAPTVLFWSSSRGTGHPADLSDGWAPFLAGPVSSLSVEAQHQYLMHPLPQRLIGTTVNALMQDPGRAQLVREPRYREELDVLDYLAVLPATEEDAPPEPGHTIELVPASDEPASSDRFGHVRGLLVETGTLVGRRLRHLRQTPWRLISVALNPLILIVALGYLFEKAIVIPGYQGKYMSFLLAGVAAQAALQNIGPTAVAIRADLDKGLFDRFRSLPMGRGIVLLAHSVADFLIGVAGMFIVVLGGFLAGWRLETDLAGFAFGLLVLLLFTYTCVWVGIGVGQLVSNLESIESIGVALSIGLSFLSNALLAPGTLPKWLQPFAEWNPVSAVATSVRQAWGNPTAQGASIAGHFPLLVVGVFCAFVLLVVPPVTQRRYRKGD